MGVARSVVDGVLRHFTTDQAVRAGVTTAAWSVAASYGRGLLPRTPVQQAAATGVVVATHYVIGATTWSVIASTAAGLPGHRPGQQALLTAAALNAAGGKAVEMRLRHRSGDSLAYGAAWSAAKMISIVGLAGGLVTAADVVVHDSMQVPRSPSSTLALDLAMGGLMAAGTIVRRRRRAQRFGSVGPTHHPVAVPKDADGRPSTLATAKTAGYVGGVAVGTALSLGALAVGEQLVARRVSRALNVAVSADLGEFGDLVGHAVTAGGFAVLAYTALRQVRVRVERREEVIEPAYPLPPSSDHVSCGPRSEVAFEDIGKEGRRFVTMRLSTSEIEAVVGGPAVDPVRIVVPDHGSAGERAQLAVRELRATGGTERSLICVASPTGVGYVNYTMAEALEYLAGGDCAIVVPQYAYVPSALALDQTGEGTQVQRAVIAAIRAELDRRPGGSRTRLVQFGESLGAQVALDVGEHGVAGFDAVGLESGLYLGVPFRSAAWRSYIRAPDAPLWDGRLIDVPDADHCPPGPGRHVMVNHHDDPINKFAYSMVVQRPWWFGPAECRPPLVPRETYFRPITSFVLGLVDLLNGMNMKPGAFRRVGHDYRFDMRQALQKAYSLPVDSQQAANIEGALRQREQQWAEIRLIAKAGDKALRAIVEKVNAWGADSVNIALNEQPADVASTRLLEYLAARLGSRGSITEDSSDEG
jgi:uncharacterized membrane protein